MATAMNTTVKVFKGVPLVKGGSEVLYMSQGSAEGVLPGLTKTYTQYYYTRENASYIQVDDPLEAIEGCNYMTFVNVSHGNKIFFCFIDSLQYISDSCTQINFTVDPFPTFLGDCKESDSVYVVRNTVKTDTRGLYLADDFSPKVAKQVWKTGASATVFLAACTTPLLFFVCNDTLGSFITASGQNTAVQVKIGASPSDIGNILDKSGTILGCYLVPASWASSTVAVADSGIALTTSVNNMGSFTNNKIKTGVYGKAVLKTTNATKYYEIEDFDDPTSIVFRCLRLMIPSPSIHVYPTNYRGMAHNLSEGLTMNVPMIPIATPQTYTQGQVVTDIFATAGSAIGGAMAGSAIGAVGGVPGWFIGGAMGALSGLGNMAKNQFMTRFAPPSATTSSFPMIDDDYNLKANLDIITYPQDTLAMIDDYLTYHGYAINGQMAKADINLDDKAYLQTGSIFLSGSEADDEINARLMQGIKIRKTLS